MGPCSRLLRLKYQYDQIQPEFSWDLFCQSDPLTQNWGGNTGLGRWQRCEPNNSTRPEASAECILMLVKHKPPTASV